MIQETEEIFLIRHRFGRTKEIWTAYNVFLKQEVLVGEKYICYHPFVVQQTTHTLLITYYSYLYSLFDPSGTNFIEATKPLVDKLEERTKNVRQEIINHWEIIQEPINKIRHNIGFHGGKKVKNQKSGYSAYADTNLHPWSPDYILQLLRVFFRDLDKIVSRSEDYFKHISDEDTDKIYEYAKKIKHTIDTVPIEQIFKDFVNHLNKEENENG
jgi:hypothetical protein